MHSGSERRIEEEHSPTDHETFLRLFTRFDGKLRAYVAALLPTREGVENVLYHALVHYSY
ncbi:MAG: hypothetical protein CMJ50_02895 [Planctomycetaceae bacterium]|nr:hypothetical protein [Planctomycetaceae bacterium]